MKLRTVLWMWAAAVGCGREPITSASDATQIATTDAMQTMTAIDASSTEVPPTSTTTVPEPTTSSATTLGTTTADTTGDASTGDSGVACDPMPEALPEDQFAEILGAAICAQKMTCDCEVDFACETNFVQEFAGVRAYGQANGLAYDGVCAARMLNALIKHRGCEMASMFQSDACGYDLCRIYAGDAGPGEACEIPAELLTYMMAPICASRSCSPFEKVCVDKVPPQDLPTVADGEPCFDPMLGSIAKCMPDSSCDYGDTGNCEPLRDEGEPCLGPGRCKIGLYCTDDGVCAARGQSGAPCTDAIQCLSGRCTDGTCDDWVWICEVAEGVDLIAADPEQF